MILHVYSFDHMDYNKLWKILKRWECQSTVPVSWETCIQVKKQQSERKKKKKTGLKLKKTKNMASYSITSWQIDAEKVETVTDFIFLGSKITVNGDCSYEIKRCLLLGR